MTPRGLIKAGAAVAGGALAYWFFSRRREATPAWIQKKQRKEARRKTARRGQERPPARPGEVHVEVEAATGLAVPLGEQLK